MSVTSGAGNWAEMGDMRPHRLAYSLVCRHVAACTGFRGFYYLFKKDSPDQPAHMGVSPCFDAGPVNHPLL